MLKKNPPVLINELQACNSIEEFAEKLGINQCMKNKSSKRHSQITSKELIINPSQITPAQENEKKLLLNHILENKLRYYSYFRINKKRGGFRDIFAPQSELKFMLRKINRKLLQNPDLDSIIPYVVHGYVKGKNIVSNARLHLRKDIIINLDIKDFFISIKQNTVQNLFMSEPFNFNITISKMLADLLTLNGKVPQGAPTSPALSNLICVNMDYYLKELANQVGMEYTRYADDLSFSADSRYGINKIIHEKDLQKEFIQEVKDILSEFGFTLNPQKIKIKTKNTVQEVTGLIVNEKLNVRREYIKNLRAILHSWETNGFWAAKEKYWQKYYKSRKVDCFIHSIRGKIEYLGMVRGKNNTTYLSLALKYHKLLSQEPDMHIHISRMNRTKRGINDQINLSEKGNPLKKMYTISDIRIQEIDEVYSRIGLT